jgi:hypothetical protein
MSQPVSYDFTIYLGTYTTKIFTYYSKDSNGVKTPIDLTGFNARFAAKVNSLDATPALELSSVDGGITLGGAAGTIQLNFTPTNTANLPDDEMSYVLYLIDASNHPLPPIIIGTNNFDSSTLPSGG